MPDYDLKLGRHVNSGVEGCVAVEYRYRPVGYSDSLQRIGDWDIGFKHLNWISNPCIVCDVAQMSQLKWGCKFLQTNSVCLHAAFFRTPTLKFVAPPCPLYKLNFFTLQDRNWRNGKIRSPYFACPLSRDRRRCENNGWRIFYRRSYYLVQQPKTAKIEGAKIL